MAVTLTGTQLDTMLAALEDAGEYRTADTGCARCGDGLCDDCRADAQQRIRYASLAIRLMKEAGRG